MNNFNEQIRDLIRENKLEIAFDVLVDFAERNRVMDSDFVLLQGSYNALLDKISAGLIPESEANSELNGIRKGLYDRFKEVINEMQFDNVAEVKLLESKKKAYEIAHPEVTIELDSPVKNDEKTGIRALIGRINGWVSVLGTVGVVGILGIIIMSIFYLKPFNSNNQISSKKQKKIDAFVQDSLDKITKADTLTHQAMRLIYNERFPDAILKCDSALSFKTEKPMNWHANEWAELYNLKAECLLNLGNHIEAEECVKKALTIDPTDAEGYVHSTYAQILADKYAKVGPKFFEHFTFALDKKLELWEFMEQKGFVKIKDDPAVKKLLDKYRGN
jgi:tetratricopeptide (TPR) repeat protein